MPKGNKAILTAEHPTRGLLWAAVDPSVRFTVPGVRDSRFAARLAPFATVADAEAALEAEGCRLERVSA